MIELHFMRPLWLLLLPVMIWLGLALRHHERTQSGWHKICSPHLLPHLLQQTAFTTAKPLWLALLFWLLAITTLAGPSMGKKVQPIYRSNNTRVIVVDLSQDMLATDLQPSRIERAKFKLYDLIRQLPVGNTALIAYADAPYLVAPPTHDAATLKLLVEALKPEIMPANGHAASSALQLATTILQQNHARDGAIIWIAGSNATEDLNPAIRGMINANYQLYILGAATTAGVPIPSSSGFVHDAAGNLYLSSIPESDFSALARQTGGFYQRIQNTDADLQQLLPALEPHSHKPVISSVRQAELWEDQGYWLLLLLAPLVMYWVRLGRL